MSFTTEESDYDVAGADDIDEVASCELKSNQNRVAVFIPIFFGSERTSPVETVARKILQNVLHFNRLVIPNGAQIAINKPKCLGIIAVVSVTQLPSYERIENELETLSGKGYLLRDIWGIVLDYLVLELFIGMDLNFRHRSTTDGEIIESTSQGDDLVVQGNPEIVYRDSDNASLLIVTCARRF